MCRWSEVEGVGQILITESQFTPVVGTGDGVLSDPLF